MNNIFSRYSKKRLVCLVMITLLLVSVLAGCGSGKNAIFDEAGYSTSGSSGEFAMEGEYSDSATDDNENVSKENLTDGSTNYAQKLVYTYYFSYQTTEYDKAMAMIEERLAAYGGYMESCSVYGESSRTANMVLRVPVEKKDAFIKDTEGLGTLISKETSTENVSLEYYDVTARLESLHAQHDRLLELMGKAENLTDIAALESQLSNVEYEINSYQTRLNVLNNQVDYVTIRVYLDEVKVITPVEEDTFLTRIVKGFTTNTEDVLEGVVDFAVWLITMVPYFIILFLIAVVATVVFRFLNRNKGPRKERKPRKTRKNQKKEFEVPADIEKNASVNVTEEEK